MAGPPARAGLGLATPPGRPSRRSPWRSGSDGEAPGRPQGETPPPAASPLLQCGVADALRRAISPPVRRPAVPFPRRKAQSDLRPERSCEERLGNTQRGGARVGRRSPPRRHRRGCRRGRTRGRVAGRRDDFGQHHHGAPRPDDRLRPSASTRSRSVEVTPSNSRQYSCCRRQHLRKG